MVTVHHIMVRLERMLDYRGVGLERFHCMCLHDYGYGYEILFNMGEPLVRGATILSAHQSGPGCGSRGTHLCCLQ